MSDYPQGIDKLMEFVFDRMEKMPITPLLDDIKRELEKAFEKSNASIDKILQILEPRTTPMNDTQLMKEILSELEGCRRATDGLAELTRGLTERLRWVETCTRQVAHKLKTGAIDEKGGLG